MSNVQIRFTRLRCHSILVSLFRVNGRRGVDIYSCIRPPEALEPPEDLEASDGESPLLGVLTVSP